MQKRTHIIFGLFFFSLFHFLGLPFEYSLLVGVAAFFPDIDWLMDKVWFKRDSPVKKLWGWLFKSRSMHRTLLHNIWAMLFFVLVSGYLSNWNLLTIFAVALGYFSHLLLDSITLSGIYWLWPYGDERFFGEKKFFVNGSFRTGSLSEKFVFIVIFVVSSLLLGFGFCHGNYSALLRQGIYNILTYLAILIFIGAIFLKVLLAIVSKGTSRLLSLDKGNLVQRLSSWRVLEQEEKRSIELRRSRKDGTSKKAGKKYERKKVIRRDSFQRPRRDLNPDQGIRSPSFYPG